MALRNPNLIPFLIVPDRNRAMVFPDNMPPGLSALEMVNPQELKNAEFVQMVQRLDDLSFGPRGMRMPGWVFYDCGVMPGMVFGFGARPSEVRPWIRQVLEVPDDYEGLVPLTLFIAIAMLPDDAWLVNTLTGLNEVAPGATSQRLVRNTLATGLSLLKVETLYATVQWRSRVFRHYTALGPLNVLTAWTPAHDIPSTLTFRVNIDNQCVQSLFHGSEELSPLAPPPNHVIDVDEADALRSLQKKVESGAQVQVIAPPQNLGRYTLGLMNVKEAEA